ncbi:hypothetical protein AAZX31_08G209400 [Glycine max]|uniref:Uncharacterized protein n=1 Tax=Glycine max TaxID=3847 RepID=K7L7X5_SOYBN|nr:hypothetical protein JHK85_022468 [Glycine max]KAH1052338.1 hypothetical protein GYH30_021936 [Glycine max]KRH44458.1 hypothetical protein GLYMA_08G212200v4 [Glycine max]
MKCLEMALVSVTTANSSKHILLRTLSRSHAFSFSLHRQFQPLSSSSAVLRRLPRCHAASPGPPLPPSENDSSRHLKVLGLLDLCCTTTTTTPYPTRWAFRPLLHKKKKKTKLGADVATSLSKIQDRIQIFFAVLFWMSLFFWASAWDGRNRPDKGSRFRR